MNDDLKKRNRKIVGAIIAERRYDKALERMTPAEREAAFQKWQTGQRKRLEAKRGRLSAKARKIY